MFKKISDLLKSKKSPVEEFKENWNSFRCFYENILLKPKLLEDKKMLEKREVIESLKRIGWYSYLILNSDLYRNDFA